MLSQQLVNLKYGDLAAQMKHTTLSLVELLHVHGGSSASRGSHPHGVNILGFVTVAMMVVVLLTMLALLLARDKRCRGDEYEDVAFEVRPQRQQASSPVPFRQPTSKVPAAPISSRVPQLARPPPLDPPQAPHKLVQPTPHKAAATSAVASQSQAPTASVPNPPVVASASSGLRGEPPRPPVLSFFPMGAPDDDEELVFTTEDLQAVRR